AGRIDQRLAIDQRTARGAERQADPALRLRAHAIAFCERKPAAVTLVEIIGDVGQFDQLVDIDVRRIAEADDDIGTGAGVRGHRSLLVDVLPADEVDLDLDAGLVGELLGVGAEHVLVGLNEAHRPQHAQGRAVLDRQRRRRHVRSLDLRCVLRRSTGDGQCRRGSSQRQRVATRDLVRHVVCTPCLFFCFLPGVGRRRRALSSRCARRAKDRS
ncbi:hypothetical protein chiPu_0031508, partial [Chiloscyllium punctatum]|nr:hypothetical protein [Chiloscyllium punctatum]